MNLDRRLSRLEDETGAGRRPRSHTVFINTGETDPDADPPRFATDEEAQAWADRLPPEDTVVLFNVVNPERKPDSR
jgi:hypothetical protein